MSEARARVIAFYLPQFFPIAENDKWWGKGFTEWTNVAKARPLFRGHWQPRIPADLGFYDLRLEETRIQQTDFARSAGVESFCYWHYWFGNGRRILERPFEEVLNRGTPNFPFCLAWANQSWTGIWHGNPQASLIKQEYPGRADQEAHFRWASRAFHDSRYSRVDGKPIFVVFAPHDLPSTAEFIDHWRELAVRDGLPGIYFVAISNSYAPGIDKYNNPILTPFDAVTPLSPQDFLETLGQKKRNLLANRIRERNLGPTFQQLTKGRFKKPSRYDYVDVVNNALNDMPRTERFLPCVMPNWDNTPRSGPRGVVYERSTPELFGKYLEKAVKIVAERQPSKRIVFLKAWNEWAEGNYVEPDTRFGHAYLDTLRSVIYGGS